jgi:NADPH:quinone reductase-like Zn-dependent oxidoreductase
MPPNTAAWLTAAKAKPLEVKPSDYTSPGENEIVIKNGALAINPVDWKIQDYAFFPLKYPAILGEDVAGTVVDVGSSVSRFSNCDRVLGHALGLATQKASDGAFQEYTVVSANVASPIPSTLSFESAAVLPLALSTAATGLFQKENLALQHPSLDPKPTGQTLLVWGGSSSVGSNAIQLAVAAGYVVLTTASPKNFEYTKKLGASQVFDYNSKTVTNEIVEALKGKTVAGVLDAIGADGAFQNSADVLAQSEGNKFIATVLQPPEDIPAGVSAKVCNFSEYFIPYSVVLRYLSIPELQNVSLLGNADPENLQWIQAPTIKNNEVGKVIYEDFLPQALADGKYLAAPEPYIVGKGLESVQAGLDAQKKGVSAKKLVITL